MSKSSDRRDAIIALGADVLTSLAPEVEGVTKTDVATEVAAQMGDDTVVDDILNGINGLWAAITLQADADLAKRTGRYEWEGNKTPKRDLHVTVGDGQSTVGGEVMFLSAHPGPRDVDMVYQGGVAYIVSSVLGHRRTTRLGIRSLQRSARINEMLAHSPNATDANRFDDWHTRFVLGADRNATTLTRVMKEFKGGAASDHDVFDALKKVEDLNTSAAVEILQWVDDVIAGVA